MELRRFDKHFVKNTGKKAPQRKILEFFLLDTVKTTFQMKDLIQKWTQSGFFSPKIRALFSIFKKRTGEASPRSPYLRAWHVWMKPAFLLLTLTWQTLSTLNVCMKTLNELCFSLSLGILCLQNLYLDKYHWFIQSTLKIPTIVQR